MANKNEALLIEDKQTIKLAKKYLKDYRKREIRTEKMKPIEDLIRNCSLDHNLAEGFESQVFAKIKRKKTVKKISYTFTAFFVVGVILFLSFIFS